MQPDRLPNLTSSSSVGSILYIEDDEDTRELVTYLLARSNYKVVPAENYDNALLLAQANLFDLYLIDNWVSGGSGIDLCKKLRELNPWTPILFYSGAAYERDKQQAFAAGAQGYLVKPVDNDELIEEISRIISAAKRAHGGDNVERDVIKG
jgi:two-component system phosphate regulon response regulator PhoB